ncbi:MAG: Fe(3+) ABC transporter substrate-binding protein [Betaproteobacteria bacterium]|nr:Fe(3+) ABC transporter substrate-binding protein [Betaproteobacteria bacterium]
MSLFIRFILTILWPVSWALAMTPVLAQENILNLYSSRHYETDEALYANFTKLTGIKVNRIEANENALLERIRNEGARSPADVLLTVDAGRLWTAEQMGLLQPVRSQQLESRIPASMREPSGLWFGFSMRARLIAFDRGRVKPGEIRSYEDLADPKWKGKLCVRSGSHMYNLSLVSAMIDQHGEAGAETWAKALAGNLARSPKGGDTDQLRSVAAGECQLALANSYYYARLMRSDKPEDKALVERVGVVFPNQASGEGGAHVNISGAGVLKNAPHRDAAVKFLEYLATDSAQEYFANGNNEWPVVANLQVANPALAKLGRFGYDTRNVAALGRNQPAAKKIVDRAGWK